MELKGIVVDITEPKVVSDKLTKQMLVLEWKNDRGYANKTAFEFKKSGTYDTIAKIAGVKKGQEITVMYNEPTSREYNGTWYTSVEGWGVKGAASGGGQPIAEDVESDSLPF